MATPVPRAMLLILASAGGFAVALFVASAGSSAASSFSASGTAPLAIGKVITFTTQKTKVPARTNRCLPPGATSPVACT
jgi:hypothetical protein